MAQRIFLAGAGAGVVALACVVLVFLLPLPTPLAIILYAVFGLIFLGSVLIFGRLLVIEN